MRRFNFWGAIASIAPIIPYLLLGGVVLFFFKKISHSLITKEVINPFSSTVITSSDQQKINNDLIKNKGFSLESTVDQIHLAIDGFFWFDKPVFVYFLDNLTIDQWRQVHFRYGEKYSHPLNNVLKKDYFVITDIFLRPRISKLYREMNINGVTF